MDERVARLKTPEECEQFALNVQARLPELALEARRRSVELKAAAHGAKTVAEREALEAVYAYERALFHKHGKNIRASRTWQMIKKNGIIAAIEQVVKRKADSAGYKALVEMGMRGLAFEVVVLKHPVLFTEEAIAQSTKRLKDWEHDSK